MRKKVLLIVPILLVLAITFFLNTQREMGGVTPTQVPAAASPRPSAVPSSSPSPTPAPSPEADPKVIARQQSLAKGQQIADFALGYWGCEYQYGGETPEEGFDCSGLVYHVYGTFGYPMERVADRQAKQGQEVSAEELIPGDILCFYTSGKYVGHVGIYVGNNHYIHAMGEAYGVVVTSLDNPDLKREFTARRIIEWEFESEEEAVTAEAEPSAAAADDGDPSEAEADTETSGDENTT